MLSWSRGDDKRLLRLIQYIDSTPHYRLVGTINDNPEDLELRLYVDADFAGDRLTGKSTSGGYLVLFGPNSFFPLAWVSQRQTSTSRWITESEVVSLAHSLYQEGLPALQLWELLLGRAVVLRVLEDNQATILVVRKGYSPKLRHITRTHKVSQKYSTTTLPSWSTVRQMIRPQISSQKHCRPKSGLQRSAF